MSKDNKLKNVVFFSIIVIILLVLFVISVIYTVFVLSSNGVKDNKVSIGTILFTYSDKSTGISIKNGLPISDVVGRKLERDESDGGLKGYFEFTISCDKIGSKPINYEIYTEKESFQNEIDADYVKIYLTDGDTDMPLSKYGVVVPTYSSLDISVNNKAGKSLYTGTFTKNEIKKFKLRMWLADTYTVNNLKKKFAIKINVKAEN